LSSGGRSKRVVTPGDALGVIEEYLPGEGIYVNGNGLLRSSTTGIAEIDHSKKIINIKPVKMAKLPKAGSSVIGIVTSLRSDLVIVTIHGEVEIDRRGSIRSLRELPGRLMGAIPLAQIADERVRNVHDYFRIGDIIIAGTLNSANPYTLTTRPPRYGVVFASCARCGHPLKPVSDRQMKCPRCGNLERRKVSTLAPPEPERLRLRRWLYVPVRP
jgi:exosome complex component CSL4